MAPCPDLPFTEGRPGLEGPPPPGPRTRGLEADPGICKPEVLCPGALSFRPPMWPGWLLHGAQPWALRARLASAPGTGSCILVLGPGEGGRENRSSDPVMFTRAGPLLSSTGPFIGSPINPLGLPEVQRAWTPGLAAAPRPAGGHGQQVGQERGGSLRCASVSQSLHWDHGSCPCTLGIGWKKPRGPSWLCPSRPESASSDRRAFKASLRLVARTV